MKFSLYYLPLPLPLYVLFCVMTLQTCSCRALVPLYQRDLAICFMQQGIKFTEGLTRMTCFFCQYPDLISHTYTHTHTHTHTEKHTENTGTNKLTHKYNYILTLPVMCTRQLAVLHLTDNLLIQKFTLRSFTMLLLSKNYLQKSYIC